MTDHTMFQCPRSSLSMIAGLPAEYTLHSLPNLKEPEILDIGAHVGGFAWYALGRWPGGRATCYEPHPSTFRLLRENTYGLAAILHDRAVVHPRKSDAMVRLYEGVAAEGRHACSLRDDVRWPHLSQDLSSWVDVETIDAADLGPCDVLKVDTEGSEVEILTGYKHLSKVRVLLVEAHAVGGDLAGQMAKIRSIALTAGLLLVGHSGSVQRFARQ